MTAGYDLNSIPKFLAPDRSRYSAADVIAALLNEESIQRAANSGQSARR